MIDGDSNSTSDVTVSATTDVLAVNPASNKIYVGSVGGTVIDGLTNTPSGTASFTSPVAVVVNPVTGKAYMVDNGNDSVTVIAEQNVNSIPLKANIVPIANNISATLTPTTGFSATSTFSPTSPAPTGLFFQADTWQGTWTQAQSSHGNFVGQTPTLQPGFHILYAFATDGQDATSVNTGRQSAPLVSNVAAYGFLVGPPQASLSTSSLDLGGAPLGVATSAQTVTLSNTGPSALTVTDISMSGANAADFSVTPCSTGGFSIAAGSSCDIAVTLTPSVIGTESATLTITDNSGGVDGAMQTVALSGGGKDFELTAVDTAQTIPPGSTATYNLQLTPGDQFTETVTLACANLPPLSACTVKPSTVTLDGTNPTDVTLDVTTTGPKISSVPSPGRFNPPQGFWLLTATLLGLLALGGISLRSVPVRAARKYLALASLLLLVAFWASCISGRLQGGTPAGTYNISVTATSGSLSHSATVTLTVR